MVRLTLEEENWLQDNYPQLKYDRERSVIYGSFPINHTYNNLTIKDVFEIEVRLWRMSNRSVYPLVYNADGRINKIAKRKNMNSEDLHVYENNCLCLGLPERFSEYYPLGFELPIFFKHLCEHLYWVAYYERYNKAPWLAELHGDNAKVDYYIEKHDIDGLRKLYKTILGRGIARQKLCNYLASDYLTYLLKKKLYKI